MTNEDPQSRPNIKTVFDELQSQRGVMRQVKTIADFDLD